MSNQLKIIIETIDQLMDRFKTMVDLSNLDPRLSDWFLYDLKELKKMVEELK
jgi:hypothetical protein